MEPLSWLNDRLARGLSGCYLRFNDGEAYSMSGMKVTPESNGEHVYSASIRNDLLAAYSASLTASAEGDGDVIVGSWWYEDPTHPAAEWLRSAAEAWGLVDKVRWSRGHVWHREEGGCPNEELLELVRRLRESGVVLYGPEFLQPVAVGLRAVHVVVPETDAEGAAPVRLVSNGASVYCCGFPAKRWALTDWRETRKNGTRSKVVVDAGSLFDGLCGRVSREWLRPNSGPHADFYYGAFRKAVLG